LRPDQSFFKLTPERVLEAVESGGIACRPLCYPLNSFENRVYEVELDTGERVVAKFYRPGRWSAEQILEEHAFLAELAAEEIPVCAMRPFPDGSTLKSIDGIYYALADRRGGRAPDEPGDKGALRLGRIVARVHNVGAQVEAVHRPKLTADHYIRRPLRWLRQHDTLPKRVRARYVQAAETIAAVADERMIGVETLRLHADLHLGNILLRDDLVRLLDFDDMVTGPPVQDLWLALPGRDDETRRKRALFLEGYEQFREFDRRSLSLIEPLRGLRLVRYAVWLARRWEDPAFPAGWPQFADADFWDRETASLEELLGVIDSEPLVTAEDPPPSLLDHGSEGEGLTNRDYFWDWEEE